MADPIKPKYGKKATETKSPKQKRFQSPEEMETEEGMQPEATVAPQESAKSVTNAPADKLPTAPTVAPEVTKDYSKGMTLEEAERMTPEQRRAVGLTDELYERQSQKYQEVKGNFSNYGKGQHWVNTEASAKNNMFAGNTPAATDIAASNVAINPLATNPNKATVKPKIGGGDLRTQTRKEAMRAGTYYDDAGKAATYWDAKSQTRKMKDGTEMTSAVKPKGGSSKRSKSDLLDALNGQESLQSGLVSKYEYNRARQPTKRNAEAEGYIPKEWDENAQTELSVREKAAMQNMESNVFVDKAKNKLNSIKGKNKLSQQSPQDKLTGLHQDTQTVKPKRGTPLQEVKRSAEQNGYKKEEIEKNGKKLKSVPRIKTRSYAEASEIVLGKKWGDMYDGEYDANKKIMDEFVTGKPSKELYSHLMLQANKNYNKDTGAGVKGWHEHHSVAEKLLGRPLTEDEKTEFNVKVSNGTQPHQALGAIIKKDLDLVPSEDYKRGVEEGKKKYLNTKKGFNKIISLEDAHMKTWGKILSQEEFNATSIKDRLKFTQAMYGKAAPKNEEELIKFGEAFGGQHNDNTAQLEAVAAYRSAKGKPETIQATPNPMQVKTDTVKPKGFPKWDDKTRSEGQKASLKDVRAELKEQKEEDYEMAGAKEAFDTGRRFGEQEYLFRKNPYLFGYKKAQANRVKPEDKALTSDQIATMEHRDAKEYQKYLQEKWGKDAPKTKEEQEFVNTLAEDETTAIRMLKERREGKPIPENPDSDSGRVDEVKKLAKKEGYNIVSPMGVNRGTITYKPIGKSQITELPKGVKPDSTGIVTLTVDEFEAMRKATVAKKPSTVKPKKQPKK